jgi:hypothetical protein
MKTRLKKNSKQAGSSFASGYQRKPSAQAEFEDKRDSSALQHSVIQGIDNSPMMTMQRKQLEASITDSVQRMEDEEELLQGKFDAGQRQRDMEEEELMQGKFSQPVQRQGSEEEELLQGKFSQTLQRQELDEEELMQGKFSEPVQREQESVAAPNQTGMPDNLKQGIESLSGMDISDVRVHYNSPKPAQLSAHAFAQGNDIHLGSGQEKHLPHEAWHTVQQRQGRVQPTAQMAGEKINDDAGLEQEADIMGAKALQYKK